MKICYCIQKRVYGSTSPTCMGFFGTTLRIVWKIVTVMLYFQVRPSIHFLAKRKVFFRHAVSLKLIAKIAIQFFFMNNIVEVNYKLYISEIDLNWLGNIADWQSLLDPVVRNKTLQCTCEKLNYLSCAHVIKSHKSIVFRDTTFTFCFEFGN